MALLASGGCALSMVLGSCGSEERAPRRGGSDEIDVGPRGGSAMVVGTWLGAGSGGGGALGGGAGTSTVMAGAAGSFVFEGQAGSAGMPSGGCTPNPDCLELCSAYGPDPACGMGSAAQCPCICQERLALSCPQELNSLLSCVTSAQAADIDCSATGRIFESCVDESLALEDCELRVNEAACGSSTPVCTALCRSARLAFCDSGPESVGDCTCGCERSAALGCDGVLDAFAECAGAEPTFACDDAGRPESIACPVEWQAVVECLQLDPGDAGPARPLFP